MTKRPRVTAQELQDRLNQDPEFIKRQAEKQRSRIRRSEANQLLQKPILDDLHLADIHVLCISEVTKLPKVLKVKAFSILARHLHFEHPQCIMAGLIAALSDKDAKMVVKELLAEFIKLHSTGIANNAKWQLGFALYRLRRYIPVQTLIALAQDTRHRSERMGIIYALGKRKKDPRVAAVLTKLTTDSDIGGHARKALLGEKFWC